MQFDSINAFLNMGGYGFYVWLSYGVTAFSIILLIVMSYQNHKNTMQHIAQRYVRENKRKEAAEQQRIKQPNTLTIAETNNESSP